MKSILKVSVAAAAIMLAGGIALAADAPPLTKKAVAKASTAAPGAPYVGIGTVGAIANASAAAPNAGTPLYSTGAGIKGVLGYGWTFAPSTTNPLSPTFAFVEGGVIWNNLGGTQTCATGISCSVGSSWGVELGAAVSCPWTEPLAIFPSISQWFSGIVPPLPANVTATSSLPYCGIWAHADDISGSIGAATGTAWRLAPAVGIGLLNNVTIGGLPNTIDTRAEVVFPNTSVEFGTNGQNVNLGTTYRVSVTLKL